MTIKTEQLIKEWGTWIFRGIVSIACVLIWNEAKEIKRDVKTLMEERQVIQSRVGRAEKDIDLIQNAQTNLWNRLRDHELNDKSK